MKNKRRPGVVSVILVNFRGVDDTVSCVRRLTEGDWPTEALEIIVVENGSGDGSLEHLAEIADLITIVDAKANLGFTGGCNLGASHSTGEFVAFLNNDARPDPAWITEAIATFAEGADIGAVASKVLDWEGEKVDFVDAASTWYGMGYKPHAGERDHGSWDDQRDVLFGTGAAMFVRAEVFEELGGFDDDYFMFYEDVDFGWRLNLRGYRYRYQPKSLAFHKHHASMEKFGNYHETYLLERNALFTLYKNLDDEAFARMFPAALLLAVRRAVGRGGLDSASLDLRNLDDDRSASASVSKQTLAGLFAIDQVVENLPALARKREAVQAGRVRSDRQLRRLFRNRDEPAYPIDVYLDGYEKIMDALGVLDDVPRRHILIITGDPVGEKMAGPAIRAWNMADVLSKDHDVRLLSTSKAIDRGQSFELSTVSPHRISSMAEHEQWADVIIVQGHAIELFPILQTTSKVLVVDVYDPLHLEQLEQGRHQNFSSWSRQVSEATETLNNQLQVGDFFLCASERQRHFWLGQLAGLGRVNPFTYSRDSELDSLIAVAPFGIPAGTPQSTGKALRGVVPGIGADDKVVIWGGGIYNWFDPESLIRAIHRLSHEHTDIRLFFMGTQHPNPAVPEMAAAGRARQVSDELGLTGKFVFFNDSWVAYDDRQNYLLEADLGVSTHFQHVETTFSFRTRVLDYLWAGLPIVSTDGDSFGDLVESEELGVAVPERDIDALVAAIEKTLYDPAFVAIARENVQRVRESFEWPRVLAPLIAFCADPLLAADKKPASRTGQDAVVKKGRGLSERVRHTGVRRDLDRVVYYLREGGPRAVVERFAMRQKRKKGNMR